MSDKTFYILMMVAGAYSVARSGWIRSSSARGQRDPVGGRSAGYGTLLGIVGVVLFVLGLLSLLAPSHKP